MTDVSGAVPREYESYSAKPERRGGEYDWLHKVVGKPAHGGRQP